MKNKKGFTLAEVIISIAALGIICAVLLRLFVMAGSTNRRAGDMQAAQIHMISSVETVLSAKTLDDGLHALDMRIQGDDKKGVCTAEHEDLTIMLQYSEKQGEYPGTLYDITIQVIEADEVLAAVDTMKYDKERRDD